MQKEVRIFFKNGTTIDVEQMAADSIAEALFVDDNAHWCSVYIDEKIIELMINVNEITHFADIKLYCEDKDKK